MTKVYDFDVTVTCRHDEIDDNLKLSAVEEILKLSKYHSHIIDADITIDKHNSALYRADVSLRVPGRTFIATHEDYVASTAIDTAIDKTKNQLKKLKSKIADHRAVPLTQQSSMIEDPSLSEADADAEE